MTIGKQVFATKDELAEAIAEQSIKILREAIVSYDYAVWILAGGSTPGAAYQIIAKKYLDAVDWSKVIFIIGDERIAPLDSSDSNWHAAEELLLCHIPQATFIRPLSNKAAEVAARQYAAAISILPKTDTGYPRFHLVWLGVGEDGHTLSLFPNHSNEEQGDYLVIPVRNSPKPPADRITLTYRALIGAEQCMIMAAGSGKAAILKRVYAGENLPITRAAAIPVHTMWFLDRAAADSE